MLAHQCSVVGYLSGTGVSRAEVGVLKHKVLVLALLDFFVPLVSCGLQVVLNSAEFSSQETGQLLGSKLCCFLGFGA